MGGANGILRKRKFQDIIKYFQKHKDFQFEDTRFGNMHPSGLSLEGIKIEYKKGLWVAYYRWERMTKQKEPITLKDKILVVLLSGAIMVGGIGLGVVITIAMSISFLPMTNHYEHCKILNNDPACFCTQENHGQLTQQSGSLLSATRYFCDGKEFACGSNVCQFINRQYIVGEIPLVPNPNWSDSKCKNYWRQ